MRLSCGIVLLVGSLIGMVLSFISDIVVNSSLASFNGMEISMVLGLFFVITFFGSLYILVSGT